MKKLFLKWSDGYINLLGETRLITQFSAFSIAVMTSLMLAGFIYRIFQADEISAKLWQTIAGDAALDLFVIALFGSRFLLLFSARPRFVWLSQVIWIIAFTTISLQHASSEFGGCVKNAFPAFGENLSYVFVFYLIFSPLRQLSTLFVSFVKIFIR